MAVTVTANSDLTPDEERILRKVLWKIVPFLLFCYIIAYLDRVNVGIVGLQLLVHLDEAARADLDAGFFEAGDF